MKCYSHSKEQTREKYKNLNFISTTAVNRKSVEFKFKNEQDIKDLRIFSCSAILNLKFPKKSFPCFTCDVHISLSLNKSPNLYLSLSKSWSVKDPH